MEGGGDESAGIEDVKKEVRREKGGCWRVVNSTENWTLDTRLGDV